MADRWGPAGRPPLPIRLADYFMHLFFGYPEALQKPFVYRNLKTWRIAIAILYVPILIITVETYRMNNYQFKEKHFMIWLWGCIIFRLIGPLHNFLKPPRGPMELVLGLYHLIHMIWSIMAICGLEEVLMYLKKDEIFGLINDPVKTMWRWILIVYVIERAMNIGYLMIVLDDGEKGVTEVTTDAVEKNIKTHGFYNECVICLQKFTPKNMVKDLPCRHLFHPDCIDSWLKMNSSCPSCKLKI